mmetsp:Transcript_51405/g.159155  ORF Transcript_51405/g.159155 Transcript_51405/m.159155 type:complete len:221 (+) Transcript_51405:437-1099(+)
MPWLEPHWKYCTPSTEPSFLPSGRSSSTPNQGPGANCVGPAKRTVPWNFSSTTTRVPSTIAGDMASQTEEPGRREAAAALGRAVLTTAGPLPPLSGSQCLFADSSFTPLGRAKRPLAGSQLKYCTCSTLPSFLPSGWSSSTPTQGPGANCVEPTKRTTPGNLSSTTTRTPRATSGGTASKCEGRGCCWRAPGAASKPRPAGPRPEGRGVAASVLASAGRS